MATACRAARRGCNTPERRSILSAWWVFYFLDKTHPADVTPEKIQEWLEEAEASPEGCDAELAEQYPTEYVSQVPI